jgi:integrase
MTSIRFSKTALQGLALPPQGKRITVYDKEVSKLALRITPTGSKSFYVVKRTGSTMTWVRLGAFPEMTVEQARTAAQKTLGEFANGANPAQAKRAFKAEPTLSAFFAEYGSRHAQRKASWKDDQQRFRDYLEPPLGNKKLSEIDRAMVSRVLGDAEKAGKAVATLRQIRALVSSMLGKAVEWGYLAINPVSGIRIAGAAVKRDRFLQAGELPSFFASVAQEPPCMRDFVLLCLLTGARRGNVCAMHWQEIDLEGAVWHIQRTKNGEPQMVTLCPEAVEVLKARQALTAPGGFVFPGTGKTGHLVEPKKAIERVLERAGIPYGRKAQNGVTLHDLRRTLGSWQARTGASLAIIGKSLNHKSPQATAIYARLDLDPVRQSVNTATSAMLEAAGLKEKAEVVELRTKKKSMA